MVVYDVQFVKGLQSDNPWWSSEPMVEVPPFKRSDYSHFIGELHQSKVNVLLGPRRCGKTTIIQQIIQYLLYEKRADPKRIFFVSLDRPFFEMHQQKLQDAITYYEEKIIGRSLQDSKEVIYLFIDEAHYDPQWSKIMKQYVDQNLPIHSIVSGSSAPAIGQNQESAAGRFYIHQMVTMKFRDIVRLRDPENDSKINELSKKLRIALIDSFANKNLQEYERVVNELITLPNSQIDTIKRCLNEYLLKGGYPEFYFTDKSWREISRHYQTDVFDVILQKDVVTISNIRQPQKIRTLFVLITQNTARPMTRHKIREKIVLATDATVDQYVDALSEAFLVRTSTRFRIGKGYPSTKPKKYYAADPGLRNAVLGIEDIDSQPEDRGAVLETAIFNHCFRLLFHADNQIRQEGSYWDDGTETDIILDLRTKYGITVPVEVKNGNCGEEDQRKMKSVMNKINAPFGFIICKDQIGLTENNIYLLPPWVFLLSC